MIHHINRATAKATARPERIEGVPGSRRHRGRSNPAVRSFAAGRDHGGDPGPNAGIQEPHRRRDELGPQIAVMPADVPTCTGSGADD